MQRPSDAPPWVVGDEYYGRRLIERPVNPPTREGGTTTHADIIADVSATEARYGEPSRSAEENAKRIADLLNGQQRPTNPTPGVPATAHRPEYMRHAKRFCEDWISDVHVEDEMEEALCELESMLAKAFADGHDEVQRRWRALFNQLDVALTEAGAPAAVDGVGQSYQARIMTLGQRTDYAPPDPCAVPAGQTHPTCNDCFAAGRGDALEDAAQWCEDWADINRDEHAIQALAAESCAAKIRRLAAKELDEHPRSETARPVSDQCARCWARGSKPCEVCNYPLPRKESP